MLNFNEIKNDYEFFKKQLLKKKFVLNTKKLQELEKKRKKLQIISEKKEFFHKKMSNYMLKIQKLYKNIFFFKEYLIFFKKKIFIFKKKLIFIQNEIHNFLITIPNIPDISVPEGSDYKKNQELKRWGVILKYKGKPKNHIEIAKKLNGLDNERSVSMSGNGFIILKGKIAKLHRALSQFMLDTHIYKHGYHEIYVPNLVHEKCMFGTGQLPKFYEELFQVCTFKNSQHEKNIKNYFLIPTAEVPLINLFRNTIVSTEKLPLKLVAVSSCFRAESATYGKKNQGLIRNNQFEKVEIVQITYPENSIKALEELTQHAENILKLLELPYRKVLLCTGDLGFSACKTYDLEVWLPSQNNYCEISSCSMIGDFQSRRIKARFKDKKLKKNIFLHTLNGSGLAVGRTLAAILENFYYANGKVKIPEILYPYMNGEKFL